MSGGDNFANSKRPIRLYSPSVDFIERRLAGYHPVFEQSNLEYDENMDEFVISDQEPGMASVTGLQVVSALPVRSIIQAPAENPDDRAITDSSQTLPPSQAVFRPLPPEVEDMMFWELIWPKAMARLRETEEPSGRSKKGFSIREAKGWKDVADVLERACKEYEGRTGNQVLGKAKRAVRKLGEKVAGPVKQINKLVPSDPIATPVLGAVSMLMSAREEVTKVRSKITETFSQESLDAFFSAAELYCGMFQDDQNIINAAVNLLLALFEATEGAVGFYISWQVQRGGKATFQGEQYLQPFRNSLDLIKTRAIELRNEGNQSSQYQTHTRMQRIEEKLDKALARRATNVFYVLIGDYELPGGQNSSTLSSQDRILLSSDVLSIHSIHSRAATPEPPGLSTSGSSCTADGLLKLLEWPGVDEEDMESVLASAEAFQNADRARAELVVTTPDFRDWFVTHGSTRLLINGDYDERDEYTDVSPLSGLCVALVHTLRKRPGFVSLLFVCGLHWNEYRHDIPGPSGMLRSFIVQLLSQCPSACPGVLDNRISLSSVEDGDVDDLTKLFVALVGHMPSSTTLVVIIDGVQVFESLEFRRDLLNFMESFVELLERKDGSRINVKLLLTRPADIGGMGQDLVELIGEDNVLSVRLLEDTGDGPTRDGIAGQIQREVNSSSEEEEED